MLVQCFVEVVKDIKVLIFVLVDKIGDGNVLVNKFGEIMVNIVIVIKCVNDIMFEIVVVLFE